MTQGRARSLFLIVAGAALMIPATARAAQLESSTASEGTRVPGELIVRYRASVSGRGRSSSLAAVNGRVKQQLLLPHTELVAVPAGSESSALSALNRDADVVYAEPNRLQHIDATPNDTFFGDLWGLNNTGQTVNGVAGTGDADIDAPEAWNLGFNLGSTGTVAFIDSGMAQHQPDLAANLFTNPGEAGALATNGIDDDGNGFVDDVHGWDFVNNDNDPEDDNHHGTHVSGTIAARGNNALGVTGVASFPRLTGGWASPKIVPLQVLAAGVFGPVADIADAFVYAGRIG